jgi:hypothetical protein
VIPEAIGAPDQIAEGNVGKILFVGGRVVVVFKQSASRAIGGGLRKRRITIFLCSSACRNRLYKVLGLLRFAEG